MSERDVGGAFVVVLLGPAVKEEVMRRTLDVLNHFGIPYQMADWKDDSLSNILARADSEGGVVVFGTGIAYTDEHYPSLQDILLPVIKVVTDPPTVSGQLLTNTQLVMMAGFGVDGAVNAGQLAARILATNNAALRNLLHTKPYPCS